MNFKIIAVDFDGTLCENKYPGIGAPNIELIEYLNVEQQMGNKIILWTCRCGDRLIEALNWCETHGLIFDAVNNNVRDAIDEFGSDSRKVYADEYIDDKSCTRFRLPYVAGEKPQRYLVQLSQHYDVELRCNVLCYLYSDGTIERYVADGE